MKVIINESKFGNNYLLFDDVDEYHGSITGDYHMIEDDMLRIYRTNSIVRVATIFFDEIIVK